MCASSSLMAEIWALRDGLTLAKESNLHNLEVEVDARGVIPLLNDVNAKNHPLRNILLDCRSLMLELDVVAIKHIYREANRCANVLANDAPVSVGDFHVYPFIPSCIATLLYADLSKVAYPRLVNA
ncbi:hypothetical protein RHMOL_Rhmol12G0034900 [Rhododendron molle]|uniref:Uncharacterized protein n=1 Tax=Rhododendron molle TaxID=49168 RepID=A0ACC0LEE2_RHOML|nr:hypothetical protein RHMOL_Rhmol12G0034900 [Rhododendron molle]